MVKGSGGDKQWNGVRTLAASKLGLLQSYSASASKCTQRSEYCADGGLPGPKSNGRWF